MKVDDVLVGIRVKVDEALTETIADMIRNFNTCGCCGSNENHLDLLKRALERTPVDWWPDASIAEKDFVQSIYQTVHHALVQRRITWNPITKVKTEEPEEQCSDCGAIVLGYHACQGRP